MRSAARTPSGANREFTLSDREFAELCRLVRELTGISLGEAKRDLVYSRFSKRLRDLGLRSFEAYCRFVEDGDEQERVHFANAITTNLTSFFREAHHFDFLAERVLPEIRARTDRRVRIWSAGCSTGEEPYSIAMTVLETFASLHGWDVKILATDLDSSVIDKASGGIYDRRRIEGLEEHRAKRWFTTESGGAHVAVVSKVRELVHFRQLNLMDPWPMRGQFDVIFCRNTVIYFDKPTQRVLFDRFADLQPIGGYLFIGHSETLNRVTERYKLVGPTIYRKAH